MRKQKWKKKWKKDTEEKEQEVDMQMNDKISPDSKLYNNERSYFTIPTLEIIIK